jgi:hypothetical protein
MTLALLLCGAVVLGIVIGYLLAVSRTANLLASMSPEELSAMAKRVVKRRVPMGQGGTANPPPRPPTINGHIQPSA